MSAVWLLTTRARPDWCQQVLDACTATGMTSQGLVYVDQTVKPYRKIRLPDNWEIHYEPEWGSIAASMRYCQARFPDATQYGWLSDDQFPRTTGWDKKLEEAAGDWNIAIARDLWMSETGWTHPTGGPCFTAGLCWGAKLIEAAGWWALPGVYQGGIDGAWNDIAGILNLTRYLPDVTVEHVTWKIGKREKDENDEWVRNGRTLIATDLATYEHWAATRRRAVCNRIQAAMK